MKSKISVLFITVALSICSCDQSKEPLKSYTIVMKIRDEISKKYGEQVSISILNSKYLLITLTNSKMNNQPKDKQNKYAIEIALYVQDNLSALNNITEIRLKFISRTEHGIIYSESTIARYIFSIDELGKYRERHFISGEQ